MWSKRQGQMHVVSSPMFPGYLFVRQKMDKHAYIEMLKVRGLVRILEDGWNRLTPVPDQEVAAVERVLQAKVPVFRHGALHEGDHVRVTSGPLTGLEGVYVQDRPGTGRLVVSVGLLGRGVAVEIDGTSVKPCQRELIIMRPLTIAAFVVPDARHRRGRAGAESRHRDPVGIVRRRSTTTTCRQPRTATPARCCSCAPASRPTMNRRA